jgi:hypothetical protein
VLLDRARFPHASATLTARDGNLDASARIEQTDGFADVRGFAGVAGRAIEVLLVYHGIRREV